MQGVPLSPPPPPPQMAFVGAPPPPPFLRIPMQPTPEQLAIAM
jgi:hypothetical protein